MAYLFLRMVIAAFTVNSIGYYFISHKIAYFNCLIAIWCFIEWVEAFRQSRTNELRICSATFEPTLPYG